MSGIDNIAQKILADAQAQADVLLQEGQAEAEAILKEAEADAQAQAQKIQDKAALEAERTRERILSAAQLKARDVRLSAKQKALSGVFEKAKAGLETMKDAEFTELVKAAAKSVNINPQAKILVPQSRLKAVKDLGLVQAVEAGILTSGFQFVQDGVVLNYDFDALVDYVRTDLEAQVAQTLFGK